jgi:manganese transport protein
MANETKSLEEVNATVDTTAKRGFFKKLAAFMGPAYLVSVGYMDPGNWATDIAGGSQFGYALIWVLLMSNVMALLLQSLSVRLGIVRGRDLAQSCRESYPAGINYILYFLAETAIISTDLAEVLGMAIGLQLLFGIPLIYGVLLTFTDTLLLLFLLNRGMRKTEAFILALIGVIGIAFFVEMILVSPDTTELAKGFIPSLPGDAALYIAIGIIGATVMPHNLYLHSSLVQTRKFNKTRVNIGEALKFNFIDSAVALNMAFFVNAAIMILAAGTFYKAGLFQVSEIQDAYKFLSPILGTEWASILFAVALISAGQSSTITGTLAGQIIMEGFINFRIQPWARRIITRSLAILPAILVLIYFGEEYTGKLLILSQVVLSLQLGFAVIPLIHFVSDKKSMGKFAIKLHVKIMSWIIALIIVVLNIKLVLGEFSHRVQISENPGIYYLVFIPLFSVIIAVLIYVIIAPFVRKAKAKRAETFVHGKEIIPVIDTKTEYSKILVALDFSHADYAAVKHALSLGNPKSEFLFLHIVESAAAIIYGDETEDLESDNDEKRITKLAEKVAAGSYNITGRVGYGNPKILIPRFAKSFNADIIVMGAHGHGWFKDLIFGTTVESVRHKVDIPVLIVKDAL